MAVVTVLRETEFEYGILVLGTAQETNTRIVDASTLQNAKTSVTFHHLVLREVAWSISGSAVITLSWEGSPNLPFLYLSGSGYFELSDRMGVKIRNTATSATGDVFLTLSANANYSLVLVFEKTSEGYDKQMRYL
ncbi:MAG: hypothetical protein N3A54_00515 [Patescibacteria group bacterium]|nr:hypothetical protein [Patescibacteria group bacterium]